jgi:peptidylprolyl isomerase
VSHSGTDSFFVRYLMLVAVLCLALALAGCGDDDASSSDQVEESTQTSNLTKSLPEANPPDSPPSKLVIRDLREGSGPGLRRGDRPAVHYVGVDIKGKEDYSNYTYNDGKPLEWDFGSGAYFRGWEEGLRGMKAGGRRELWIPKHLSQEKLKPLFYVVELLAIKARKSRPAQPVTPDVNPPENPPNKLVIRDLKEGSGPGVKTGDKIVVHYIGADDEGIEIYSSYKYGRPLEYDNGSGSSSRGWEEGLVGMKVGGRRELWIPKRLAQGKREPLFYIVDLLEIK